MISDQPATISPSAPFGSAAIAEADGSLQRGAFLPVSLCRAHIEKIVGSVTFMRAQQLRRLLRWLGERSLAPNPTAPSEKEIASSVLRRQDFDPQSDSLVRKEMCRLREKLGRYYLSEGAKDEVRVRSGGGYLFTFEHNGVAALEDSQACWLVLPFRSGAASAEIAGELHEELLFGLTTVERLTVVAPTTALAYGERSGDVREFAAECRADYVVEGSIRQRSELFEANIWLVEGLSGRVLRAKKFSSEAIREIAISTVTWLVMGGATS